ncbi:aminodeoxychorismate/anthranilate synthase component 2 [Oxobacter pfennigii]|uniref:Aminodeoxychorismate/anthranilate synthase component 2 n=1 Tax=Oxobacter pfennigii TaxID=36849 RepID=A0A0P8YV63_9CLOT|nr:aminodeoxychorismate/anthranilate synthase component II [Oxobacter pfennigii]KPU43594.1 aminodeoxychorismate/anthranilate synthase component 2 [Oxobacter pfennigii]
MLVMIDNYDSFTYNLYQYIGEIYSNIKVIRNDKTTVDEIWDLKPKGIVLSPGPGRPEDAGICAGVIKELGKEIPILGICLGHQAIGHAYGGKVVGAEVIMHGKTSIISHDSDGLFKGISQPLNVMRYHSLVVDKEDFPDELNVTAQTKDGVIMGVRHKKYHVYGLQFHPESIMTEQGKDILKNFVEVINNASASN